MSPEEQQDDAWAEIGRRREAKRRAHHRRRRILLIGFLVSLVILYFVLRMN